MKFEFKKSVDVSLKVFRIGFRMGRVQSWELNSGKIEDSTKLFFNLYYLT
jgi:hypothetical protein